jgi:hypothetical protein
MLRYVNYRFSLETILLVVCLGKNLSHMLAAINQKHICGVDF